VYIRLAAVPAPVADKPNQPAPMRSEFPLELRRRASAIKLLPLASAPLAVRRDGDYSAAPRFAGFEPEISYVGGINRPKVVRALSAGGVLPPRRELVKSGSDDLRQDAAIQQFFALVNALLAADGAAAARALRLRTYRAVPFSPSSGLLQWVDDCVPLSEYLLGADRNSGAHGRRGMRAHRAAGPPGLRGDTPPPPPPPPILHGTAAAAMQRSRPQDLRATFDWVCDRFPPVLRYFLTEHFRSPRAWAAARLSYARSTAAASMAGYVIGLGDRHSHNILLDLRSAEAVHIDLGIAFEQGSFLATPELVPFRLTRDVVDGLGPAGVDGVLRGACEAAMSAMRAPDARAALASVVEVLVHDPLYKWGISEEKKGNQQRRAKEQGGGGGGGGEEVEEDDGNDPVAISITNADAERALLRVRNKLAGLDAGDGEARGIRAQVRQLLADAADPALLCRMYVGWAAWV
jgi:ataxia telangiectasia mutated family protein